MGGQWGDMGGHWGDTWGRIKSHGQRRLFWIRSLFGIQYLGFGIQAVSGAPIREGGDSLPILGGSRGGFFRISGPPGHQSRVKFHARLRLFTGDSGFIIWDSLFGIFIWDSFFGIRDSLFRIQAVSGAPIRAGGALPRENLGFIPPHRGQGREMDEAGLNSTDTAVYLGFIIGDLGFRRCREHQSSPN